MERSHRFLFLGTIFTPDASAFKPGSTALRLLFALAK